MGFTSQLHVIGIEGAQLHQITTPQEVAGLLKDYQPPSYPNKALLRPHFLAGVGNEMTAPKTPKEAST